MTFCHGRAGIEVLGEEVVVIVVESSGIPYCFGQGLPTH